MSHIRFPLTFFMNMCNQNSQDDMNDKNVLAISDYNLNFEEAFIAEKNKENRV